ncbi:transglutaminase-like domain-containing protein [Nakamurella lactea]|uniref:transglutaminase-like domain-containing protein n=1 Tax=Nakamurella lactea TaxID=459515 RepID=UPI00041B7503|nr:transglutaminase-like domain-containing protein [Nakamurella lactea]
MSAGVQDRPVVTDADTVEGATGKPPRPALGRRALIGATVVMTLASMFLGSTFGGWWPALLLAGECWLVLGLFVVAVRLRVPVLLAGPGIGVVVIVLGYLMVSGTPRVGPDTEIARPAWRVLLDSVAALLSTPPGTPARLDLLAPAFLLVGLAHTFVVVRAQLRGPGRPMGIAPIVMAPLLYAAGQLLTAGAADRWGVVAAALVLVTLLAWTPISMPAIGAAAVCAVCATLVALSNPAPGWDVRQYVTPPRIVVEQQNLLPQLSAWQDRNADGWDTELFTVAGVVPDRVAVADYIGYDGNSWSTGTDFALFGSPRLSELATGTLTAAYSMRVTPGKLPGDLLPAGGRVASVSLADAVQDLTGGSIGRIGQGSDPRPYTVTGSVDVADDASLSTAGVPDQQAAAPYLQTPTVSDDLRTWVDAVVRDYPGRYDQAAALEAALRQGRSVDPKDSGSTSMYAVAELVGAGPAQPAKSASAENFVSAFAVLARSIGLPTKVVVGAQLSAAPGVTEATRPVLGRDMSVWPEVYFSGVGWVAFDPVPGPNKTPAQQHHERVKAEQSTQTQEDSEILQVDPDAAAGAAVGGGGWAAGARVGAAVGGSLLVGSLLLALLGGFAVLLRLRRRGAAGAWTAVERGARLARIPLGIDWPTERVALAISERVGPQVGRTAETVARQAERECFGPDGTAVAPGTWRDALQVRKAMKATLSPAGRIGWYLRPAAWRRRV